MIFNLERKIVNLISGENGESGTTSDGTNGGIKTPEIVPFHPIQFLNDYLDNMSMGSGHLFRKSYFQRFLTQLSESPTIQLLIDKYHDTIDTHSDTTENEDHFVLN